MLNEWMYLYCKLWLYKWNAVTWHVHYNKTNKSKNNNRRAQYNMTDSVLKTQIWKLQYHIYRSFYYAHNNCHSNLKCNFTSYIFYKVSTFFSKPCYYFSTSKVSTHNPMLKHYLHTFETHYLHIGGTLQKY